MKRSNSWECILWRDIGLARNMCKIQPRNLIPPWAPPVRELWVACSATQELPTRLSYAPNTSKKSNSVFFPSNARWLSPGRLSSRKDNCILQIRRINAVATSVMTTMCIQKRTELDHNPLSCHRVKQKKQTTKTKHQTKHTETPQKHTKNHGDQLVSSQASETYQKR